MVFRKGWFEGKGWLEGEGEGGLEGEGEMLGEGGLELEHMMEREGVLSGRKGWMGSRRGRECWRGTSGEGDMKTDKLHGAHIAQEAGE